MHGTKEGNTHARTFLDLPRRYQSVSVMHAVPGTPQGEKRRQRACHQRRHSPETRTASLGAAAALTQRPEDTM